VPVSLVDVFPTLIESAGLDPHPEDKNLPGESLLGIAQRGSRQHYILSEYHAAWRRHGSFMIRWNHYKYIYYVGMPAMLFDLQKDPEECVLGSDPSYAQVLQECERLYVLL
jgi:choline-sulfatase